MLIIKHLLSHNVKNCIFKGKNYQQKNHFFKRCEVYIRAFFKKEILHLVDLS